MQMLVTDAAGYTGAHHAERSVANVHDVVVPADIETLTLTREVREWDAPHRVVRNSLPPGHQNRLALAPAGSDIWYAAENGCARPYQMLVS